MSLGLRTLAGKPAAFFKRSKFSRAVVILAGGTVIARGITALSSPLLSRMYAPADFGALQVFVSSVTMLLSAAALNYEAAIPLPEEDNTAFNLMGAAFALLAVNTVVCGLVLWLFGAYLARLMRAEPLVPYLWLVPASVFGGGSFIILNSWALRVQSFRSLAKRRVTQSICQVAAQVVTPFWIVGPLGLLLGDSAGRAGGSIALAREVFADRKARGLVIDPAEMYRSAKRYKKFPLVGLSTVLVHNSLSVLPPLLLSWLYGLAAAGWYSLVNQALGMSLGIIGLSIAQVYVSNAAQLARTSPDGLRSLFVKTSRSALLVGVAPLLLLVVIGPWLFGFVFGGKWVESGVYSQFLAISFLAQFVVGPVFPTLTVLERQDWQMAADLFGLVSMAGGMWYVHSIGLSARWAIGVYGASLTATYLLLFALAYIAIKCHRARWREEVIGE